MKSNEFNLSKIIQEEENDNLIYCLREEVLENVFKHIDTAEDEKQNIKFVADCAYEALVKLLTMEFYHHNTMINPLDGGWLADKPPNPSPPDTWAAKRVSLVPKPVIKDTILESESECPSCHCNLGVDCKCFLSPDAREKDNIDMLFNTSVDICEEESTEYSLNESDGDNSCEVEEETKEIVMAVAEPIVDVKPKPCILKEGFSKIGITKKFTVLPRIILPTPIRKTTQSEVLHLPPIRVDTTFDYRLDAPQLKADKKSKEKAKKGT